MTKIQDPLTTNSGNQILEFVDFLKFGACDQEFQEPAESSKPKLLKDIQGVLVKNTKGKTQKALTLLYSLDLDKSPDWQIDDSDSKEFFSWEGQKEEALFALTNFNMVFLKGMPGVGKSYVSDELAKSLKYKKDQIDNFILVPVA